MTSKLNIPHEVEIRTQLQRAAMIVAEAKELNVYVRADKDAYITILENSDKEQVASIEMPKTKMVDFGETMLGGEVRAQSKPEFSKTIHEIMDLFSILTGARKHEARMN